MSGSVGVLLFTRDLRLHDQPVLAAASAHERVLPLFVHDEALLRTGFPGRHRRAFLDACLADLDADLRRRGSLLVVRHGDLPTEVARVAESVNAAAVYTARDVSAFSARRAARLAAALAGQRRTLQLVDGVHTVVAPGSVVPAGSDHFAVFTPYLRRWERERQEGGWRPLAPTPTWLRPPDGWGEPEPGGNGLPQRNTGPGHPPPTQGGDPTTHCQTTRRQNPVGNRPPVDNSVPMPRTCPSGTAARQAARRWLDGAVRHYADRRDDLAADATSRLSAALHFGCLSARELAEKAMGVPGGEAFARQLAWRDFHHQVLAARPSAAHTDYRPRRAPWRDDQHAYDAWREGQTGVPIVDAGMRQLAAEGWMHNRARLIVGSFLTKSLGLHWQLGAAHFFDHLVDGDLANNCLNWQWVAGTGTDRRPNRVLNPVRQALRYDPEGRYVRRWVPELARIEGSRVHRPWRLPDRERRSLGYPPPIIDPEPGTAARR